MTFCQLNYKLKGNNSALVAEFKGQQIMTNSYLKDIQNRKIPAHAYLLIVNVAHCILNVMVMCNLEHVVIE